LFIDQAKIYVKSGDGGRGCASFYRDKYNRYGVPDGGDGGRGGDIIARADRNLSTLLDFTYKRHFIGRHGGHGSGNGRRGKDAPSITLRVPAGTLVRDAHEGTLLRDLARDGETVVVAVGGKGGLGNKRKVEATEGERGQERKLLLDLKLIADVGLIGFPNAGKSTLISGISKAHPVIAAYPFTTKAPVLGVVHADSKTFVIADIPGLIEGSSRGRGLGDKFLRHIERTKVLVHVIDMSGFEGRDPLTDYKTINRELKQYSADVASKPQLIVANKMDLAGARANLARFRRAVKKSVVAVSALQKEGLEDFVAAIAKKL